MRRQWWIVGGLCALIVGLVGVGWLMRDRFLPLDVGSAAPSFTATDLSGQPVSLEATRGEVTLLNIWATWCPPCREEMPSMQRLHETLAPEGLNVIAVSVDAPFGSIDPNGNVGGNVEEFVRAMGLTFPIWHDPTGNIQRTYRATGVPESFLIDRNGTIIKKVIGATVWDSPANTDLIRRLLAQS